MCIKFEVYKQEQQMTIVQQSANRVQIENYNMEVDDEDHEIQKPQMKNVANKEHIKDPTVNIVSIFNLQMNNKIRE